MKAILLAAALLALLAAGCTSVTNIHYHGDEKPTVVHDTVYVQHGSTEPHEEWVIPPDTVTVPYPDPESGQQTGVVTWVEALEPGSATVEITIDYDLGATTYLMSGNLLSGSGLRFELNAMVRRWEPSGEVEYWLVPEFISARNWNGTSQETSGQQSGRITVMEEEAAPVTRSVSADGRPSGRKETSGRLLAIPEDQSSSETVPGETVLPSILLRVDHSQYELTDLNDFDCAGHATMMYGVTVRIPVNASVLEALASGTSGSAQIRDIDGTLTGTFSEETFLNFGSFMRLVSGI